MNKTILTLTHKTLYDKEDNLGVYQVKMPVAKVGAARKIAYFFGTLKDKDNEIVRKLGHSVVFKKEYVKAAYWIGKQLDCKVRILSVDPVFQVEVPLTVYKAVMV